MPTACDAPVGVLADGAAAAAVDVKPIISIQHAAQDLEQAVQELEQVVIKGEPRDGRTTEQILAEEFDPHRPHDWGRLSPANQGNRRQGYRQSNAPFPRTDMLPTQSVSTQQLRTPSDQDTPGRSKRLKNNDNGITFTRNNTHTNNSSSNNNNNNNNNNVNNYLLPPVHNVGGYNGQSNQQQYPHTHPSYNNSSHPFIATNNNYSHHSYEGVHHQQPMPDGGVYHTGGAYPNYYHQPMHQYPGNNNNPCNNPQSYGGGVRGGNYLPSMSHYPANIPPPYSEQRVGGYPTQPMHRRYPIQPMHPYPYHPQPMPPHPPSQQHYYNQNSNPPPAQQYVSQHTTRPPSSAPANILQQQHDTAPYRDSNNDNSNHSIHHDTQQQPAPAKLSTDELRAALPPGLIHLFHRNYMFVDCKIVNDGADVGHLHDLNPAELFVLHNNNGLVSKHMKHCQYKTHRKLNDKQRKYRRSESWKPKRIGTFLYENKSTLYCPVKDCNVSAHVVRIQCTNTGTKALLLYRKINESTESLYEHENHSVAHTDGEKTTLTPQQKDFIRDWAKLNKDLTTTKGRKELMLAMVRSADVDTRLAQEDNYEGFLDTVTNYIDNCNRSKNVHQHFTNKCVSSDTTADQLYKILNHLMLDPDSEERKKAFCLSDDIGPYMLSIDGGLVNKRIKVNSHDHNGTTWTYILFEFVYSPELAELAVQMFANRKVQGEMDFFMGVCHQNDWQVGHSGPSDRKHKYHPMTFIISKSENSSAAGKLLTRFTELLKNAGGDARSLLVDGGKALDKAIGIENDARHDDVLTGVCNEPEQLTDLLVQDNPTSVGESTSTAAIDDACDAIMEAFVGQPSTDDGDEEGRRNLEARLKKLLQDRKINLERCLAHITRNAGKRGGGWKGGKGSLCRALLSSGCSNKTMKKILGLVFMMSNIPCGDVETFKVATKGVLKKYEKHIKPYVMSAYLNGNPSCLGGYCSKTPGDMTSTQGCEARGGEIKKAHKEIMEPYDDPNMESRNPLHLIGAVARDAAFHSKASNPCGKFAVQPSREDIIDDVMNDLRYLGEYTPPKEVSASSRRVQKVCNLSGDWLYSFWETGDGEEVSPDEILGKQVSIKSSLPSTSCLLSSLKKVKMEKIEDMAGLPTEAQTSVPKKEQLNDIKALTRMLTILPLDERKEVKAHLAQKRLYNTVERHKGEDVVMYLYRRAQRDPVKNAYDEMCNSKYIPTKTKKKKGKAAMERIEEVVDAQLEHDKDAGEVEEVATTPASRPPSRSPSYKSEEIQIDGPGGVLDAATADVNDDGGDDSVDEDKFERRRDRVIFGNELGDWRETSYDSVTRRIHCNCKRFSYFGDCKHCVCVEILHLEQYPSGMANEQWQQIRTKIIHNLKIQCGKLK